jgi:serine/threonine protein kinase
MLEPGQVLDRYTVIDELGRGGMAVVYRVRHNALGSLHALKILTLHGASIRERLVLEGRVQAGLRHPNIVSVTDVIDVNGSPGLVMEYVAGPTLEEWLLHNKPDLETAERLFRSVLAGVRRAHREGLVHRDLKPGNVLLEITEEGIIPKVADFGLAKALAGDGGLSNTRTGIAMGTPAYMAPEQIRDAKSVDERADVFSLGCILYELVVGVAPFDGPNVLSIFNSVCEGRYVSVRERVPVSPHLDSAIQGCLQVDREQRIPSCDVLLKVLDGTFWVAPLAGATTPPPPILHPGSVPAASLGAAVGVHRIVARPSQRTIDPYADLPVAEHLSLLPDIAPSASLVPGDAPISQAAVVPRARRPSALLLAGLGVGVVVFALVAILSPGSRDIEEPLAEPPVVLAAEEPEQAPQEAEEPELRTEPRKASKSTRSKPKATSKTRKASPVAVRPKTPPAADPAPVDAPKPAIRVPETQEAPAARPRLLDQLRKAAKSSFKVQGDALAVWLVGDDGKKYSAGTELSAGSYAVKAQFKSWDGVVDAGRVQILPGSVVTIRCMEALLSCAK